MTPRFQSSAGDLLDLFLLSRELEGRSPYTCRNYRRAGAHLLGHMPVAVEEWRSEHLIRWLGALRQEQRTASGVAWYQRHAWAWLAWLLERGDLERDIRRGVGRVRVPEPVVRSVTADTFARLVATARARPTLVSGHAGQVQHYWRNLALLHLLYSTGCRRSEAAALRFADLDMATGVIEVRAATSKTKRARRVPIDRETKRALATYLTRERGKGEGLLLEMSSDAIRTYLRRLQSRAGVEVSAHDFRRGFAARVRRAGLDLGNTMTLLGHVSPVMSLRYAREGEEDAAIAAYRERVG